MKKLLVIIGGTISALILTGLAMSLLSCDKEVDNEEVDYIDDDCIEVE